MTQPRTKYCPRGKHTLPREQFAKNCSTRDGLQYQCKACQARRYHGDPSTPINRLKLQLGIDLKAKPKVRAAGGDVAGHAVRPVESGNSPSAASRRAVV